MTSCLTPSSSNLAEGCGGEVETCLPDALGSDDKDSLTVFLDKRRLMGMNRMVVATKRAEIRRIEEEAANAERRLRQQREQLDGTRARFNDFLRQSNMDQDAAVKRADMETRAKQSVIKEAMKLTGVCAAARSTTRKTKEQLAEAESFRNFLEGLTPQQWFYETLEQIRSEDERLRVAMEIEEHVRTKAAEEAARAEAAAATDATVSEGSKSDRDEPPPQSSSEEEQSAREKETAAIRAELERRTAEGLSNVHKKVQEMSFEEVRAELRALPQHCVPVYFTEPQQILSMFFDIEEANLFLIQTCQELEEEIEAVSQAKSHCDRDIENVEKMREERQHAAVEEMHGEQERLEYIAERLERARLLGSAGERIEGGCSTVEELRKMIENKVENIYLRGCKSDTAGMDVIAQLTAIEAMLVEKKAYIAKNIGSVNSPFIRAVLKQQDKERRDAAREELLRKQSDERSTAANEILAKASAPVYRNISKPVMWRSPPPDNGPKKDEKTQKKISAEDEFFM